MLTRRRLLSSALSLASALPLMRGSSAAAVKPAAGKSCPLLRGALYWYDPSLTVDQWRDELETQRKIGFDLLWLCGTRQASEGALKQFEELVRLCERRRVKLLVDCGSTGDWYTTLDLNNEKSVITRHVERLGPILKDSPALFGWYVPQEVYYCTGAMQNYISDIYPFAVETCRKESPGRPVTVSPFFILDRTKTFGDFTVPSPGDYARYWEALIERSSFDIVMLQDSGEHFAWVTDTQRRPYFAAMRRACDRAGARLWGNIECAEMNYASIEDYIAVNGRVHHAAAKEPRWRPVPMPRFESKMRLAAEFCEDFVTWGYREFCRPAVGEATRDWYEAYRAYRDACLTRRSATARDAAPRDAAPRDAAPRDAAR